MSRLIEYIVTGADGTEREVRFKGRDAWALDELIGAGEVGCTPITRPAPRWSGYVHKLRRAGLHIETLHEAHGGEFRGHHGRYILRSRVRRITPRDNMLAGFLRRARSAAVAVGLYGDDAA